MPAAVNRIGERHGKLSVLAKSDRKPRSFWICQCECGKEVVVSNSNLKAGNTTSCGCEWKRAVKGEMVGRQFGSLVVVRELPGVSYGNSVFASYSCRCECGGEIETLGMSLRSGDTKSCGCAYKTAGSFRTKSDEHKRTVANRCNQKRRAAKLLAYMPFDEELLDLVSAESFALARLRLLATGLPHDVDHVVPLSSKVVCGLHNEFNLRVIPAKQNRSKGNRYWPGMF